MPVIGCRFYILQTFALLAIRLLAYLAKKTCISAGQWVQILYLTDLRPTVLANRLLVYLANCKIICISALQIRSDIILLFVRFCVNIVKCVIFQEHAFSCWLRQPNTPVLANYSK